MATTVNMHEAKANLSKLVKMVEAGEEVVIARGNKPAVRLARLEPAKSGLPFGQFRGKLKMLDGFDDIPEGFEDYV